MTTVLRGRAVARVTGDALPFLHATLSQDLEHLKPGEGVLACLLGEKAHVLGELRVLALEGGDALIDGDDAGEAIEYLARVAPLSGCEVEQLDWKVTAARGIDAVMTEHSHAPHDGGFIVGVAWGGTGHDVIAPAPLEETATFERFEAARIAAGRPRYGIDITSEMMVNETPLLSRAVSFAKGWYPGQESVARVHNLGRIRRQVVGLALGTEASAGDEVFAGETSVGRISSAAGEHAIAFVRADAPETVTVNGAPSVLRAL